MATETKLDDLKTPSGRNKRLSKYLDPATGTWATLDITKIERTKDGWQVHYN